MRFDQQPKTTRLGLCTGFTGREIPLYVTLHERLKSTHQNQGTRRTHKPLSCYVRHRLRLLVEETRNGTLERGRRGYLCPQLYRLCHLRLRSEPLHCKPAVPGVICQRPNLGPIADGSHPECQSYLSPSQSRGCTPQYPRGYPWEQDPGILIKRLRQNLFPSRYCFGLHCAPHIPQHGPPCRTVFRDYFWGAVRQIP